MFKKAGAVLLSAALVASLAACSGSGGGGGDGDDPTKPMTLNLSTWTYTTPAVIQYWDEAVAGFKKKHPKVTVKINQIPLADYYDDECIEAVRRVYARELEFFGYEPPATKAPAAAHV